MDWKQQWIDGVLEKVPEGAYRERAQAELRDHLETQYRALMGAGRTRDEARAEALRVMGAPEALRGEYLSAWRRTWPARLEELRRCLLAWGGGLTVMFWGQILGRCLTGRNLSGSWLSRLLPLLCALGAGAFFLSFMFRAARRPETLISAGLGVHWAFITTLHVCWEAVDDHCTFWEELIPYLTYNAGYYALTLALCVLLGLLFGQMSKGMGRSAAA